MSWLKGVSKEYVWEKQAEKNLAYFSQLSYTNFLNNYAS